MTGAAMIRRAAVLLIAAAALASPTASSAEFADGYDEEFPSTLTTDNATQALTTDMQRMYGAAWETADEQWVKCPEEEYFEPAWSDLDGLYYPAAILCEARFRKGRTIRALSRMVLETPEGIDATTSQAWSSSRTWERRWTPVGKRCRKGLPPGARMWTNDATCESLIASDIEYDLAAGHLKRKQYTHGTNKAGFEELYVWRCQPKNRVVRCENQMGDAFKYLPGRKNRKHAR